MNCEMLIMNWELWIVLYRVPPWLCDQDRKRDLDETQCEPCKRRRCETCEQTERMMRLSLRNLWMLHSIHSMSQLRNVVQFFTGSVGAWPSVTVWRQLVSGVTCHFVIVVSSLPAEKFHSWHLDTKAARAQLVRLSFANQLETSCRKKVGTDILITETSTVGVVRPWVGGVGIVHVPQYHKNLSPHAHTHPKAGASVEMMCCDHMKSNGDQWGNHPSPSQPTPAFPVPINGHSDFRFNMNIWISEHSNMEYLKISKYEKDARLKIAAMGLVKCPSTSVP